MMRKVIYCFLLIAVLLAVVLTHQDAPEVGGSVTLPCQDNHHRNTPSDLLDVQWRNREHLVIRLHNGRTSQGSRFINRTHFSAEGLRNGDFSLSITHTEYSDSSRYQCVLMQEGKEVTLGEVDLKVKVPRSQSAVFVKSGQRVILSCFGHVDWSGSKVVFIQWKKWSQVVLQWKSGSLFVDPQFEGRVSVPEERIHYGDISLIFNNTHPDDQGYYMCFFQKNDDIRPATIINLTVTEQMSRVHISPGSQLELPLPYESPVVVNFLPDGGNHTVSVCEVERHQLTCSKPYSNRTLLHKNSLILRNISSADSGTFFLREKGTRRTRIVRIIQIFSLGTKKNEPLSQSEYVLILGAFLLIFLAGSAFFVKTTFWKLSRIRTQRTENMENEAERGSEMQPLQ